MPIKLPKGFQRRKSSGNVLDEVQNAEPSFKVYPRPASSGQSLDMMAAHRKPQPLRRNSFEQEDEDLFTVSRSDAANRDIGGIETSLAAPYDSAASSTRLSTSSTNPSSLDTRSDRNSYPVKQQSFNDIPVPPVHRPRSAAFLRSAGRTFSFGIKSSKGIPEPELPSPVPSERYTSPSSHSRARATTASSAATATPPRLLDSDLVLDDSELDTFGNMFDSIGNRSGRDPSRDPSPARPYPIQTSSPYISKQFSPGNKYSGKTVLSRPLELNRSAAIESSPYSWTSETSRDGLIRSPSPTKTGTQNRLPTRMSKNVTTSPRDEHDELAESYRDDNMFDNTPSRMRAHSRPSRQHAAPPTSLPDGARLTNPPESSSPVKAPTTHLPYDTDNDSEFDPSLLASAELATKYQAMKPATKPEPSKRVMTPKEFDRYKQQQNDRRRMNKAFGKVDSDESGDDYEDDVEDEVERDRQASKQRRKQEAHLAVYRQTMMKVTGEPASSRESKLGNNSGAELNNRLSGLNFDSKTANASVEEDEDEDVPLGILAAHGFPNKNRPPTKLTSSGSNPNLGSSVQLPSGSVADDQVNRGNLPAFARKLPEDPYYGAGIVNQSNRESLAFHSTPNLLLPSGAHTNHPHHPAGLVGVIAGEERARAARRGSPHAGSGQYDLPPSMSVHPDMVRSQSAGPMPNMMMMPGMPGMPLMLTPGDHAQIQMSQQMSQMMQMQMQWMQQMQQFMGNQGPVPAQDMSNVDPAMTMVRPQSVPLQSPGGPSSRSMSTLGPSMANWTSTAPTMNARPMSTYAPSIAPSERNNIGLASRYRPVSTVGEPTHEMPWQKRASTMTSTAFQPVSTATATQPLVTPTIRKIPNATDDDDDDAGWAEMAAKREKKQKSWKLRRSNNPLQELYNGTT